jgi:hypothetical protein
MPWRAETHLSPSEAAGDDGTGGGYVEHSVEPRTKLGIRFSNIPGRLFKKLVQQGCRRSKNRRRTIWGTLRV